MTPASKHKNQKKGTGECRDEAETSVGQGKTRQLS